MGIWMMVTVVLVLGLAQALLAWTVCRWVLISAEREKQAGQQATAKAEAAMATLMRLAGSLSATVGQHQDEVEIINQTLTNVDGSEGPMTTVVLGLAKQLIECNHGLQQKLLETELKLQKQAEQLTSQMLEARTDPLTMLPNRRMFDATLTREVTAAKDDPDASFSLVLLDVDHFKRVNDEFGHPAGDALLRAISRRMCGSIRETDVLCRYGGEEFALVMSGAGLQPAVRVAETLRKAVAARPFHVDGRSLNITISVGAAAFSRRETGKAFLGRVDEALYDAKRNGRDCTYYHDGEIVRPAGGGEDELVSLAAADCGNKDMFSDDDMADDDLMAASTAASILRNASPSSQNLVNLSDALRGRLKEVAGKDE